MATQTVTMSQQGRARFFVQRRYRPVHAAILAVALLVHLSLHYATYFPGLRDILADTPYFRLHVLHEAEFLLIVVYAGIVFRLVGGLVAVAVTGVTSIPFLLTPAIFGRAPRPGEVRDLAIQVGAVLVMGIIMSVLYEIVARERERRLKLAGELEKASVQIHVQNEALQQLNQQVQATNRQLSGLNQMIQTRLNHLYDDLQAAVDEETAQIKDAPPTPVKDRFSRFLQKVGDHVARR